MECTKDFSVASECSDAESTIGSSFDGSPAHSVDNSLASRGDSLCEVSYGRELLLQLRSSTETARTLPIFSISLPSEPQACGEHDDEMLLAALETRLSRESGADDRNAETFPDSYRKGWSYQEAVEANAQLGRWKDQGEPLAAHDDEALLSALEARLSRESGADDRNAETFPDCHSTGWSYEEAVEANAQLRRKSLRFEAPVVGLRASAGGRLTRSPGWTVNAREAKPASRSWNLDAQAFSPAFHQMPVEASGFVPIQRPNSFCQQAIAGTKILSTTPIASQTRSWRPSCSQFDRTKLSTQPVF